MHHFKELRPAIFQIMPIPDNQNFGEPHEESIRLGFWITFDSGYSWRESRFMNDLAGIESVLLMALSRIRNCFIKTMRLTECSLFILRLWNDNYEQWIR